MSQFRTLLLVVSIIALPLVVEAQTGDSLVIVPISIGRKIDKDLRVLDSTKVLVDIQENEISVLSKQVINRDSLLTISAMEARQSRGLCAIKMDSVTLLLKSETKRRKGNGLWRNVFIGTTAALIYLLASKP